MAVRTHELRKHMRSDACALSASKPCLIVESGAQSPRKASGNGAKRFLFVSKKACWSSKATDLITTGCMVARKIVEALLHPIEVARILRVSERTLERYRQLGIGPRYIKLGNRLIRYLMIDVEQWTQSNGSH